MEIKTKIIPRINEKDGDKKPYHLKIESTTGSAFPSSYIFSRDKLAGWEGTSDVLSFEGTYEECLEKEREVVKEIESFLSNWLENFKLAGRKRTYKFVKGKLELVEEHELEKEY